MKIKITGKSKELFDHYLKSVLNIAAVAAMGGHIPDQREIEYPRSRGRYWYHDNDGGTNRFNLYPMSNDYYANVRDEGENFIVLDFWYKYDRAGGDSFVAALCDLLDARFFDNVSIIVE